MTISAVLSWFVVVCGAPYQSACGASVALTVETVRLVALLYAVGRCAFYGVFDASVCGPENGSLRPAPYTGMNWYGAGMAYRLVTGMRYWYGGGYLYPLPYRHTRGLDIGCFLVGGMEKVHTSWAGVSAGGPGVCG